MDATASPHPTPNLLPRPVPDATPGASPSASGANRWRRLAASCHLPPPFVRRYATGVEIEDGAVRCVTLACGRARIEVVGASESPIAAGALDGLDIVEPDAIMAALADALPVRRPATGVAGFRFGEAPLLLGVCPTLVGQRALARTREGERACKAVVGHDSTRGWASRSSRAGGVWTQREVLADVERGTGLVGDTLAVDYRYETPERLRIVYIDRHHFLVRVEMFAALGHTLTALVDSAAAAANALIWRASTLERIGVWAGARGCAGWHIDTVAHRGIARPLFPPLRRDSPEALDALRTLADATVATTVASVELAGEPGAVAALAEALTGLFDTRPAPWRIPLDAPARELGCGFAVATGLALEGLLR